MPGLDGTGPQGFGSRTGRGLGVCGSVTYGQGQVTSNQWNVPQGPVYGLGRGGLPYGRGMGFGRRFGMGLFGRGFGMGLFGRGFGIGRGRRGRRF